MISLVTSLFTFSIVCRSEPVTVMFTGEVTLISSFNWLLLKGSLGVIDDVNENCSPFRILAAGRKKAEISCDVHSD